MNERKDNWIIVYNYLPVQNFSSLEIVCTSLWRPQLCTSTIYNKRGRWRSPDTGLCTNDWQTDRRQMSYVGDSKLTIEGAGATAAEAWSRSKMKVIYI